MGDNYEKLKNIVLQAINDFNEKEMYLVENDLSERCICSRFAIYLSKSLENTEFENYIADVEYNRGAEGNERSTKYLDGRLITVDLVVHKRG